MNLEYLASLSPPINIFPISNTHDSIRSRIKILEKYYNEFYLDDGNIPYHAKMARTLGNHDISDASQHAKRRNAANLSRISRDKVRFVTARTADDSQILSTIFTSQLDYIIALEKDMNDILMLNGHEPVNIIELLDIEDNSKKSNGILFQQILSAQENVLKSNKEYSTKSGENTSHLSHGLQGEQTQPIDYSISNVSLHRSSSKIEHQLDKCPVYSSSQSNDTDEINSDAIGSTLQSYPPIISMADYLRAMKVAVNQPDEYSALLNFCDKMVNLHMASFGKPLHQWT